MNPVTKVSILLIMTLCLLCSTEGLICNVCKLSRGSICLKKKGTCIAQPGEACVTISYYWDTRYAHSQQGCRPECKKEDHINIPKLIDIRCCKNDFCNRF